MPESALSVPEESKEDPGAEQERCQTMGDLAGLVKHTDFHSLLDRMPRLGCTHNRRIEGLFVGVGHIWNPQGIVHAKNTLCCEFNRYTPSPGVWIKSGLSELYKVQDFELNQYDLIGNLLELGIEE